VSKISIVRDYPDPVEKVWHALTDPEIVPLWTATGKGARPVGFAPVVGTRFQFVAAPMPGWGGIVDCEVLEVVVPTLLRFSWVGAEGETPTLVAYGLEPHGAGTRLTYEHIGFAGVGGFAMSKLLGVVRRKMLTVGLPAVLADMDDEGHLRPTSTLRPKMHP
jgi:uncharacterized protein YndB with AHSA1/START domain